MGVVHRPAQRVSRSDTPWEKILTASSLEPSRIFYLPLPAANLEPRVPVINSNQNIIAVRKFNKMQQVITPHSLGITPNVQAVSDVRPVLELTSSTWITREPTVWPHLALQTWFANICSSSLMCLCIQEHACIRSLHSPPAKKNLYTYTGYMNIWWQS